MQAEKFLSIGGLEKSFSGLRVLESVSLEVEQGESLALLGPSGSGKTTLLRLLAGFEAPDAGRILVDGEDVTSRAPARRGFGMVFQSFALFPHLSVGENVAFGLESRKMSRMGIQERVAEVLELVDLAGFQRRRVTEISGGQQQRVALARALAPEPRILLLDEPLSNLDPALRERTRRELQRALRRVGITTLVVTHEQEEAFELGDRVAVLHAGRLLQVGQARELYENPGSAFVATFVGRSSLIPAVLETAPGGARQARLLGADGSSGPSWRVRSVAELADGQAVVVAVRPEMLELCSEETPGAVHGRVAERRYTGPSTLCTVALELGVEVEVVTAGELAIAKHQNVCLAPRPQHTPPAFAEGEPT